jgi:sulfide:quinone oxidoreductase
VILHPHGKVIEADRIVALPVAVSIHIDGLPRDPDGFLPVDAHGRVRDTEDVYAAGDGTWFPLKQGGLACQQADAAAEMIAVHAGADLEPAPFKPVLRGELLTGGEPLFIRNDISGAVGDRSKSSGHILWWPPGKVAGAYLSPYLAAREQQGPEGVSPPIHRAHLAHDPATREGHGIELLGVDLVAPA